MREITKKYSNGSVTIVWKPHLCIHSGICFNGLPQVFNPWERPWVKAEGEDTSLIIDQVKRFPSGALKIMMNEKPSDEVGNDSKPES
jgi:uncharacterized Fe-S cluster protein YjdI